MVLYNRKFSSLVTSFHCLQVSFFSSKEKCSHLWYYLQIVILYNIVANLDMRYWCCLPHIDGIYIILYDVTVLFVLFNFLFFYFYSIVNLIRHRCFSVEVNYCCEPLKTQMFCAEVFITGKHLSLRYIYLVFSYGMENFIPNCVDFSYCWLNLEE